jgi:MFS family permease
MPPSSASLPRQPSTFPVLAVTFLNSLGTGVVTNGIFFLTKNAYHFDQKSNYILGILLGLTYIVGAGAAGPIVQKIKAKRGISSRAVLMGVMVLLAALCVIPIAAAHWAPTATWPIWLLVVSYSPLTGVLWPIVEGYVSGGQSGAALRSVMGSWNVVWSSAVVLSYWGMAPLIESHAVETILALGGLHLVAMAMTAALLSREPGEHLVEHHEPHPPVFSKLLIALRILLPVAYLISSTLSPYLAEALTQLHVKANWQTVFASAWLVPRVVTFFVLQRWEGWHGRWSVVVTAMIMMVCGFAAAVLAPLGANLGMAESACIATLVAGLLMFGTGMATIYSGALYYAMEVGDEGVDSGGTHEALIGLGYTAGPLCGLIPTLLVEYGAISAARFQSVVIGVVALMVMLAVAEVARRVHRETLARSRDIHTGGDARG